MLVMFTTARRITFATGMAVGLTVGTLLGAGLAHAAPGSVSDDDPSFDCTRSDNMICGPGNPTGAAPGCYNDRAQLVAPWPCYVVVSPNGTGAVYV